MSDLSRWRVNQREKGLCLDCKSPVAEGRTRCELHLAMGRIVKHRRLLLKGDHVRAVAAEYRNTHRQLIRDLGNKSKTKIRALRRKGGLCVHCGGVVACGGKMCLMCLQKAKLNKIKQFNRHPEKKIRRAERAKQWRQKCTDEGKCNRCGAPLMEEDSGKRCVNCSGSNSQEMEKRGVLQYATAN